MILIFISNPGFILDSNRVIIHNNQALIIKLLNHKQSIMELMKQSQVIKIKGSIYLFIFFLGGIRF